MKLSKIILTLAVMANASLAFAHGEDKAGPNGGEIRMPGAFHTEAIAVEKNKIKVYLLDINFKNPTVEDSSVVVSFSGHHKSNADCVKEKDYFVCSFDKGVDIKSSGTLEIKPVYKKQKGNLATYKTPLRNQSAQVQQQAKPDSNSHSNH